MLRRIYIDNFRCLVNFELQLDRLNLLLGENGSGKSTVFDVLSRLQEFIFVGAEASTTFPVDDLTQWQQLLVQQFELEIDVDQGSYRYSLAIENTPDRQRGRRVKNESLTLNGKPLFDFQDGTARLYNDDHTKGPEYPSDWGRSGIGVLQPRKGNTMLIRFREEIAKMVMVGFNPSQMSSECLGEDSRLSQGAVNFVSWYRYLSQEHQGNIFDLIQELRTVLHGFESFSLKEYGEKARVLEARFFSGDTSKKAFAYKFSELSDGQRMLIVLYTLLYGLKDLGYSLFLDEPENYVTLREIQPWLTALQDACGAGTEQAVLISHHPEVIDYLAASKGRWFDRPDNGPVRVSNEPPAAVNGLKPSEVIARGWNP